MHLSFSCPVLVNLRRNTFIVWPSLVALIDFGLTEQFLAFYPISMATHGALRVRGFLQPRLTY